MTDAPATIDAPAPDACPFGFRWSDREETFDVRPGRPLPIPGPALIVETRPRSGGKPGSTVVFRRMEPITR
ncbi:hypothetical protein [Alienimonas sp. DA493]|uniref:hypothetical protein n=1 Tax=Alienimonas sp. DA493 TaxID=3373605 RepID=UPI0037550C90